MKKRIVSFLMALVMVVSLLPVQVFAEAVDAAAGQPVEEQQEQQQQEQKQEEKQEPAQESQGNDINTYESVEVATKRVVTFSLDGVADGKYDKIITDEIKAGTDKSIIKKTYCFTINAGDELLLEKNYQYKIGKSALRYLLADETTNWSKNATTKGVTDFANDFNVSEEKLLAAGYQKESITAGCVQYYFLGILPNKIANDKERDNFAILIQVWSDSGRLTDEQQKPLADLLDTVTGENEQNWYQSGDRYNAKTKATSEKGFWTEFTAAGEPRAKAQKALKTATTEAEITAATAALQAAIDNLIPTSQLHPTKLYERLLQFRNYSDEYLEKNFTENSIVKFKAKLAEAKEYLNSLFDAEGKPTVENVYTNQSKADEYITAMSGALVDIEGLGQAQDHQKTVNALLKQYPMTANNGVYTKDSWDAFVAARDAAKDYFAKYPATEEGYSSTPGTPLYS